MKKKFYNLGARKRSLPEATKKKKKRYGTMNDKTDATDETTNAQTIDTCNRRTALEWSVEKKNWV